MRNFVVFAFIFCLGFPVVVFAAENLPAGFIAISEEKMNWADAKAWCEQKGGRLPLINGAASQSSDQIINPGTARIDGFGQIDTKNWTTPWPSSLPLDYYWTGTEAGDSPGFSWGILERVGKVSVGNFSVVYVP